MPTIRTRFFGVVDCAPEDVITFPGGVPPFVDATRFVLLSDEKKRPLVFLQSADDEHLCFITIPVRVLNAAYQFAIEPQDLATLQWTEASLDGLVSLAILTIPEQGPVTANLLGPVLINTTARIGVQAVRADTLYSHVHPLDAVPQGGAAC